jgi:hypothetical protein
MSAGQSDRHNQICACQNTTNRVFVPVNDRDRTLISRLVGHTATAEENHSHEISTTGVGRHLHRSLEIANIGQFRLPHDLMVTGLATATV